MHAEENGLRAKLPLLPDLRVNYRNVQDGMEVLIVVHFTPNTRFQLEDSMQPNNEFGLLTHLNSHLAVRNGADALLAVFRVDLQGLAAVDELDVDGDVIEELGGVVDAKVAVGESDVC